jgi:hypothetical protein
MSNDVAKVIHRTEVQAAAPLLTPTELVAGLHSAITSMQPDDMILDVINHRDGSQRLTLRCYKKDRLVKAVDEERKDG